MLLFNYKMDVHWYFHLVVETADNRASGFLPVNARLPANACLIYLY